jgi:hypothetical protein
LNVFDLVWSTRQCGSQLVVFTLNSSEFIELLTNLGKKESVGILVFGGSTVVFITRLET